jgi:uncharacterized protein YjbI with pentapeptide repeats
VANEQQVEMLHSGVGVWNGWREQNPKLIPDLSGADLGRARLSWADLCWAYLNRVNLSEANLSRANLSGANLENVDVTASVFMATLFASVSLTTIRGLSLVHPIGPSFIGVETLEATAADLAKDGSSQHEIESFLEKAGVPNEYSNSSARVSSSQFSSIHVSSATAQKIKRSLTSCYADLCQNGVRCWLATEDLKIGHKFRTRINDARGRMLIMGVGR